MLALARASGAPRLDRADAARALGADLAQLEAALDGRAPDTQGTRTGLRAGALGFVQLAEPVRFRAGWEQTASLRLRVGDATGAGRV
jgi:hypothetical protein